MGDADVLFVIDADAARAEHPVRQPVGARQAPAGGVGSVLHRHVLAVGKVGTPRLAVRAVLAKAVARGGKKALKALHVQAQFIALVHIAPAFDTHIALGPQVVGVWRVLHALGLHHGVCAANFGLAL